MASRKTSPRDATGHKRDELVKEHQAELERRQGEITLQNQAEAQRNDEIVDLTGNDPLAAGAVIQGDGLDLVRANDSRSLPLGATKHVGQSGVTVDPTTGRMTDTGQPGWVGVKTNDKGVTGTGTEGPFTVPGGTLADQRVRPTVDDKNATNVGSVGGPDPISPNPFSLRESDGPVDVSAPQGVMTLQENVQTVSQRDRVIRVNTTLENVTIGAGTDYSFVEGQQYRVPTHVADYLEELGYVWH